MRFGNRSGSIRRWDGLWWNPSWCLRRWNGRRPSARREAIGHIRKAVITLGRCPHGKRTIPAPDHPRMKILVEDETEQRTIAQIKQWAKSEGVGISEMAVTE